MAIFEQVSNFNRKSNYSGVQFGADAPLLETELNELQDIQNEARAEIVRETIHSGFTKLPTVSSTYKGANRIKLEGDGTAFVNGWEVKIPDGTIIPLEAPPTFGTRDDLVFLEVWKESVTGTDDIHEWGNEEAELITNNITDIRIGSETSRRMQLKWRLRAVSGVIANEMMEYFTYPIKSSKGTIPQAQGGLVSPVNYPLGDLHTDPVHTYGAFYNYKKRTSTVMEGKSGLYTDDVGLYIAGDGTALSKSTLATVDGYVYAIPMYCVSRRNSDGYRNDNPNGADLAREVSIIANGGFNDATSWTVTNGSVLTARASLASILTTSGTTNLPGIYTDVTSKMDEGDKIYIRTKVRTKSATAQSINLRLVNRLTDGTFGTSAQADTQASPVANTWYDLSGIVTTPDPETALLARIETQFATYTLANASTIMEVKDFLAVNLSKSYPVGSVPDDATFTAFVNSFPNSFIDALTSNPRGYVADWIEANDILHLAHKVSMSGFSYQRLLDDTFNSLVNGTLNSREKDQTKHERFNLAKAPVQADFRLVPKHVKLKDNTEAFFTNLLGIPTAEKMTVSVGEGTSIDTDNGIQLSTTYSYFNGMPFVQDPAKYYIVLAEIYSASGASDLALKITGDTSYYRGTPVNSGERKFTYQKVDSTKTVESIGLYCAGVTTSTIDQLRVYEISQAVYNMIDLDVGYIGDDLRDKFPHVDSHSALAVNYFGGKESANVIINSVNNPLYAGLKFIDDKECLVLTGDSSLVNYYFKGFEANTQYVFTVEARRVSELDAGYFIIEYTTGDPQIIKPETTSWTRLRAITDPTRTPEKVSLAYANATTSYFDVNTMKLEKLTVSTPKELNIPYGRSLVPDDYVSGESSLRLDALQTSKIVSDAQMADVVGEIVYPNYANRQPHLTVTQATTGVWSAGDTITIKQLSRIISGVIDSDTKLAKVSRDYIWGASNYEVYLDDISKLAYGDTIVFYDTETNEISKNLTVLEVNHTYNTVTLDNSVKDGYGVAWNLLATRHIAIENTASTSSPTMTATGLVGTWTGLGGTKATFTIRTPPTTTSSPIEMFYSLSNQSGLGIDKVPSRVIRAKVNGHNLVKSDTGKAITRSGFKGKLVGDIDFIPHIAKSYLSASTATITSGTEISSADYGNLALKDSMIVDTYTQTNTLMSQMVFKVNVISTLENRFGIGIYSGCSTQARKIAVAKSLITKLKWIWEGNASGPSGYGVTLFKYNIAGATWSTVGSHSDTAYTKIEYSTTDVTNADLIDSNGFAYFMVKAEASNGTVYSYLGSNFAELELETSHAESGYDVYVPEDAYPKLVDHPSLFSESDNLLPPFTDARWSLHGYSKAITPNELVLTATTSNQTSYVHVLCEPNTPFTLDAEHNGLMILKFYSATGSYLAEYATEAGGTSTGMSPVNAYTARVDFLSPSIGTFYFKNARLTMGRKSQEFKPYSKIVKRVKNLDFRGKRFNDLLLNPNKSFEGWSSTQLPLATTFSYESAQTNLDGLSAIDGILATTATSVVGEYAQMMYEFDLSHLGMSHAELVNMFTNFQLSLFGFGYGDNAGARTYSINTRYWKQSTNAWSSALGSHTSTTPTEIGYMTGGGDCISRDLKMRFLVYTTYTGTATNPATINMDYINLKLNFKALADYAPANVIKIRPDTKEFKLEYPIENLRHGNGGTVELIYDYTPFQGQETGEYLDIMNVVLNPYKGFTTANGTGGYPLYRTVNYGKAPAFMTQLVPEDTSHIVPYCLSQYVTDDYVGGYVRFENLQVIANDTMKVAYSDGIPEYIWRNALAGQMFLVERDGILYLALLEEWTDALLDRGVGGTYDKFYMFPVKDRPLIREVN